MSESKIIIERLKLQPHPEGGYYREIYRSLDSIDSGKLPARYKGRRNFATSIYFLLDKKDISHFHKIQSDEIWHFYSGSPVLIHCIDVNGNYFVNRLGNNFDNNEQPQFTIQHNMWFAAEVENKNSYCLIGCTVSPGFEFQDFELGKRNDLLALFPQHSELIKYFTQL